jgi:tetratricopeptide (TPR) repeat protein
MRVAILAASSYARSGRLPELVHLESQIEVLAQRLSERDAGFDVHVLAAERGLPERLEGLFTNPPAPVEALLFVFVGYVAVSEDGVPALVLDGERLATLSLRRLRRLVAEATPAACVVLDTVSAFEPVHAPADLVSMLGRTLAGGRDNIHLLASNREALDGAPPFTSLLALCLDWHAGGAGLSPEELFVAMRREEALFAQIPCAGLFPASGEFSVLLADAARAASAPPVTSLPPPREEAGARGDALAAAGDFEGALVEYTEAIAHLGEKETPAHADLYVRIAAALGAVSRDDDALAYLEAAVDVDPGRAAERDPEIRFRLAALNERCGDAYRALDHVVAGLRAHPGRVEGYRAALRLADRTGSPDRAWNAASALEVLGAADVNESLLAGAHRPDGLLPAQGTLSEEHWTSRLLCPERDPLVDGLFAALGDALVEVGLETARRRRRLVALDPSTEQDPATSTATLVKTLSWCARLLSVSVPKVHVLPELRNPFVVPTVERPTLLVSKALGSGLSMPELAFLWARQLVFVRPEHTAFRFFPEVSDLAALLLGTLSVAGREGSALRKLDGEPKLFARGLRRHLRPESKARLEDVARTFPLAEAGRRIQTWARAVELAAGRAGLLASGSVELAAELTRRHPLGGTLDVETQVKELLAYSVSAEYAALRAHLGVAVLR